MDVGYDVILGMDWLARHTISIDCEQKLLTLVTPKRGKLLYMATKHKHAIPIIFATRAFSMAKKGCLAYLCAVEVAKTQEPNPIELAIIKWHLNFHMFA